MQEMNQAVDCISICSASGEIRPLRLRLEGEDQQLIRVNIDQVVSTRDIPYVGAEARIFLCRARVGEAEWLFELKYHIRSHSWRILRRMY